MLFGAQDDKSIDEKSWLNLYNNHAIYFIVLLSIIKYQNLHKFGTIYRPEVEMLQCVVHSNHTLENDGDTNQLINACMI